jgi:SnoaL-like domain
MSEAIRAIERLLFAYADCIDGGDFEGLGRLFVQGEIASAAGEPMRGAEAVTRFYRRAVRLHEDGTPRTQHVVSNWVVEADEAARRATARSRYVVYQATPRLPLQAIVAGRYDDRFEQVGGAWHFARRFIHVDLVGDLSEHLSIELPR